MQPTNYRAAGAWIVLAAAGLGLIVALAGYLLPGNGIDHTEGALLVVGSTALMLVAGLAVFATSWAPPVVRTVLNWLIALDILCTAFAAYMLESSVLAVLMIVAFVAWLVAEFAPGDFAHLWTRKAVRV